jgi:hypothetical protein
MLRNKTTVEYNKLHQKLNFFGTAASPYSLTITVVRPIHSLIDHHLHARIEKSNLMQTSSLISSLNRVRSHVKLQVSSAGYHYICFHTIIKVEVPIHIFRCGSVPSV